VSELILVTGAGGFLGRHLVPVLRDAGARVRTLSRRPRAFLDGIDGVEQVAGSVTDAAAVARALDGVSAVYHLAGMVSRDAKDAGAMNEVHVKGTRTVLRACLDAGLERVAYVSTSGVVAVSKDADFVGTEDDPIAWDVIRGWPYYESKAFAEKEVADFVAAGLPVRVARPSLLLGPGDAEGSSTGDVVKFLVGDFKASLPGGVSAVDARDVAAILPALMERGAPGVGYLLGAGNLPLPDFFKLLEQVSGVKAPAFSMPRGLVDRAGGLLKRVSQLKALGGLDPQTYEMACHFWYLDDARARAELGWAPRPLAETLRDTVEDLRPGLNL
jgi:dihydroflavonol-4-reductase